jgi:hypothetical protein
MISSVKSLVMKNLYKPVLLMLLLGGMQTVNAQVPTLNSYTSASAVIYLDFDGHYVSGTMWNVYGDFNCNASGLNETQITEVFNRAAEDFRPFNINVTTSQTKYNQAPANRRIRIVVTTSYEWYGSGAGGVAYLNSFTWGDNTPAFVFSSLLGYNIKNIAEAASHEAGHTLGLRHQSSYDANCVKTSDYNWGQGTGEIGWAPIMGAGYNQNMTLWHNGPNSISCSNIQTDLSIITNATNGFGYRTDDHTDAYNTATNASFDNNEQFTISGVIEKTDDKDLFKFTMPEFGQFQLSAVPYNVGSGNAGSDLDLQVEFLDAGYNTLGIYNPGNLLSSIVDSLISAGTYYLRIDGKGNIYAPEYASLGSYSLQASYVPGTSLPLRRLEMRGRLEGELHLLNWLIDADEAVIKQVIEVSGDGRNFTILEQPLNHLRSFSYRPADTKPLQYRMHVTFDNFKEYYSNVITIRAGKTLKPQLIGNSITGANLNVSSPGVYQYQVIDRNGKLISKGLVEKGYSAISTGTIIPGIYIIRFSNSNEQWTEKFIKK